MTDYQRPFLNVCSAISYCHVVSRLCRYWVKCKSADHEPQRENHLSEFLQWWKTHWSSRHTIHRLKTMANPIETKNIKCNIFDVTLKLISIQQIFFKKMVHIQKMLNTEDNFSCAIITTYFLTLLANLLSTVPSVIWLKSMIQASFKRSFSYILRLEFIERTLRKTKSVA